MMVEVDFEVGKGQQDKIRQMIMPILMMIMMIMMMITTMTSMFDSFLLCYTKLRNC
jgi:hypothetical protein